MSTKLIFTLLGRRQCNITLLSQRGYYVSLPLKQYNEKSRQPDTEELDIINKSKLPEEKVKNVVSEAEEVVVRKAPESYFSSSIFYDELVNKFVNCMMYDGKKSVSQKLMNDTFEKIKKIQLERYHKTKNAELELDPLKIFHVAMENAKPVLGTQTMKKKGKNFQVPYPLPENRRRFLAIKWFLTSARNRPGNSTPMSEKLSKEILDAYKNEGTVIQKKTDFHKKAELHRAFAHYRWW